MIKQISLQLVVVPTTVVLLNTGEVMACGDNSTGQLGNNTITGTTNTLVSMTLSEPMIKQMRLQLLVVAFL